MQRGRMQTVLSHRSRPTSGFSPMCSPVRSGLFRSPSVFQPSQAIQWKRCLDSRPGSLFCRPLYLKTVERPDTRSAVQGLRMLAGARQRDHRDFPATGKRRAIAAWPRRFSGQVSFSCRAGSAGGSASDLSMTLLRWPIEGKSFLPAKEDIMRLDLSKQTFMLAAERPLSGFSLRLVDDMAQARPAYVDFLLHLSVTRKARNLKTVENYVRRLSDFIRFREANDLVEPTLPVARGECRSTLSSVLFPRRYPTLSQALNRCFLFGGNRNHDCNTADE